MVEDFIKDYIKLIVNSPDLIKIDSKTDGEVKNITIYAHKDDVGKIIGRNGKMISSIKTFISGNKAKDGLSYRLNVEATKEE